jgi:hypothetical protein
MTALFRPTNRFRDQLRELSGNDSVELPEGFTTEVELIPDLPPEHVLAIGITWEAFCCFIGHGKIVWMGPGVDFCAHYMNHIHHLALYLPVAELKLWNSQVPSLHHVYAPPEPETAAAAMAATCDFVVRLLATSQEDAASISGLREGFSVPISGPSLFHFFQESHANLRQFTLKYMILNEEQIRALAMTEFRPDSYGSHSRKMQAGGCCEILAVMLPLKNTSIVTEGRPIQRHECQIDHGVLAAALERGNSRVSTRLRLEY